MHVMEGRNTTCPLCSSPDSRQVSSNSHFQRCRHCGAVYNTEYHPLEYDDSYFLEDYRLQYGKTYAEDSPSLLRLAESRLEYLFRKFTLSVPPSQMRLLDIGCALGFFLKAARNYGIGSVEGIEISSYAARYCSENFSIPVTVGSFDDTAPSGRYHIITAWYFIEHAPEPRRALEKIHDLLHPGGILAFSIPSVFGPLYCFNRNRWEATHPADHLLDISPGTGRKILKNLGFSKISIRPAGIHPERMLDETSFFYPVFSRLYRTASGFINFSDTLEIFAQK